MGPRVDRAWARKRDSWQGLRVDPTTLAQAPDSKAAKGNR